MELVRCSTPCFCNASIDVHAPRSSGAFAQGLSSTGRRRSAADFSTRSIGSGSDSSRRRSISCRWCRRTPHCIVGKNGPSEDSRGKSYHAVFEHGAGFEPALPLLQSGAWPLGDPCTSSGGGSRTLVAGSKGQRPAAGRPLIILEPPLGVEPEPSRLPSERAETAGTLAAEQKVTSWKAEVEPARVGTARREQRFVEPEGVATLPSLACHASTLPLSHGLVVVDTEGVEPSISRMRAECSPVEPRTRMFLAGTTGLEPAISAVTGQRPLRAGPRSPEASALSRELPDVESRCGAPPVQDPHGASPAPARRSSTGSRATRPAPTPC